LRYEASKIYDMVSGIFNPELYSQSRSYFNSSLLREHCEELGVNYDELMVEYREAVAARKEPGAKRRALASALLLKIARKREHIVRYEGR
jgi:hypothetical protein